MKVKGQLVYEVSHRNCSPSLFLADYLMPARRPRETQRIADSAEVLLIENSHCGKSWIMNTRAIDPPWGERVIVCGLRQPTMINNPGRESYDKKLPHVPRFIQDACRESFLSKHRVKLCTSKLLYRCTIIVVLHLWSFEHRAFGEGIYLLSRNITTSYFDHLTLSGLYFVAAIYCAHCLADIRQILRYH